MITFCPVDGHLHKNEYQFLKIVAQKISFDTVILQDLFHQETNILPV